ncbi:MAG: hypothetical protein R3288_01600 [Woeseiaceae bacterium]|nr:hypothetical protein [Woeseiaceae bacterium]
MKFRTSLVLLAALAVGVTASAAEERKMKMAIAVVDDATHEEVRIDLDSEQLGFDLHDMQVGESRSVVDSNGQNVLITREADDFRFDVDGKSVRVPVRKGRHDEHRVVIDAGPGDHEAEVHVMHGRPPMHAPDGVVIISGEPIDAATQQAIESLLQSAGHGDDVRFIDHAGRPGGAHRIKIIEKRAEVVND